MSGAGPVIFVMDDTTSPAARRTLLALAAEFERRGRSATTLAVAGGAASVRRALVRAAQGAEVVHLAGARVAALACTVPLLARRVAVIDVDGAAPVRGFAALVGRALDLTGRLPRLGGPTTRGRRADRAAIAPRPAVAPAAAPRADGPPPAGALRVALALRPGRLHDLRAMLAAWKPLLAERPGSSLIVLRAPAVPLDPWPRELGVDPRSVSFREPHGHPAADLADVDVLWAHGAPEPPVEAILQAMALGVPVVCDASTSLAPGIARIGGALMRDGRWPRQFAEATRALVTEEGLWAALRRAGPILAAEHDVARGVDQLERAYRAAEDARRAPRSA